MLITILISSCLGIRFYAIFMSLVTDPGLNFFCQCSLCLMHLINVLVLFFALFCFLFHSYIFACYLQGRLPDSYDRLLQELNSELNWFTDAEQLLKEDSAISCNIKELIGQRDAQKVSQII